MSLVHTHTHTHTTHTHAHTHTHTPHTTHTHHTHMRTRTHTHTHTQSAPCQPQPLSAQGDKRNKSNPWSDSDLSSDFHQSFEEEDKLSLSVGSSLGPIGPPSRSGKMMMAAGGSFSPPTPLAKTSPTSILTMSPQRSELSPAAKSPLLGAAPPGLLPPPDKGEDTWYSERVHPYRIHVCGATSTEMSTIS